MLHVAEAARVSVATVSAYINGTTTVSQELSARIEQAIREIGYKRNAIARSLKIGTTRTIGLTVPHITNPFFTDVVSVIQQAFDRAGYAVMLCCTDEDLSNQDEQIRLLLDRMVDGLIIARVGDGAYLRETVERANVPVVLLDREVDGVDSDRVVLDNHQAVFEAITYLLDLGHRRIGYIGDIPMAGFHFTAGEDRFEGYRRALVAAGIEVRPDHHLDGRFGRDVAEALATRMLSQPDRPTAIFASNDTQAMGVLQAARNLGLDVPGDLSVVGYDDIEMADFLGLTTVRQLLFESGRRSVEALLRKLENPEQAPICDMLPIELIVRRTTAPPR